MSTESEGPARAGTGSRGKDRKRRDPISDGPRLFKRGRWWAADLRPWGGARPTLRDPAKKGKGERTELRDVARQWAEVYVARLQGETHNRQRGVKPKRTLEDAVEAYYRHREHTVEPNTYRSDRTTLAHLIDAFGKRKDVHQIGQEEVQRWFNERASTYAPTTLLTLRAHMTGFFRWAGRPLDRIVINRGHSSDPDALTDAELEATLKACKTEREHTLIRIGLATGARKAELWALEWGDFRPDGMSVRIARQVAWPATHMKGLKGKRNRTALVLPGFMDSLAREPSGRVIPGWVVSTEGAADVVQRVLTRAGAYRLGRGTHVLRHTYGRLGMERYGWSIEMLRIFLGHQSINTTMGYAHFGEEAAIRMARERTYGRAE